MNIIFSKPCFFIMCCRNIYLGFMILCDFFLSIFLNTFFFITYLFVGKKIFKLPYLYFFVLLSYSGHDAHLLPEWKTGLKEFVFDIEKVAVFTRLLTDLFTVPAYEARLFWGGVLFDQSKICRVTLVSIYKRWRCCRKSGIPGTEHFPF